MVDPLREAALGQLRELVLDHLVPHRCGEDAGGEQRVDGVVTVTAGEPLRQLVVDAVVRGATSRAGAERLVDGPVPFAEEADERARPGVGGHRQRHPLLVPRPGVDALPRARPAAGEAPGGAPAGPRLPARSSRVPYADHVTIGSAATFSATSAIGISTSCPSPVPSRCSSAASTTNAPWMPAIG